jgi:hypothetical protein
MCAVIDANVAHEVFGSSQQPAGRGFLEWINKGLGRLVAGGKLVAELDGTPAREWLRQAQNAGRVARVNDEEVNARTAQLEDEQKCRSNDPHVIALAQVSGARLLYSNDTTLHADFKDRSLIDEPAGHVYSTNKTKNFTPARRRLLARKDLCRVDP